MIAIIDTGTNPYFPVFVSTDQRVASAMPPGAQSVALAGSGGLEDRLAADAAFWDSIEPGQLYQITGTRLLVITFDPEANRPLFDSSAHGAAVTFLAAREAPDAIIVSVQVDAALDPASRVGFGRSVADAMEWVADQEWIDIVSVSLGIPPNLPGRSEVDVEMGRWLTASRRAADAGKVIVAAAGNQAAPPAGHYTNGPPWVIAVGGIQPHAQGEAWPSGKGVDVVSNYTAEVARSSDWNESTWVSGTSFAAPIVAGTLAHAMSLIAREDGDRVAFRQSLRDALNASALQISATDWDPRPPDRGDPVRDTVGYASLPIVAQPQIGWGYVNASIAETIARRVVDADLDASGEDRVAVAFQGAWQDAREAYWG